MTVKILTESAATVNTKPTTHAGSASTEQAEPSITDARPGLLLAGFLVMAALTAPGSPPVIPFETYSRGKRFETLSESGTWETDCDYELRDRVRQIFDQGRAEFFQDGMHSVFSRSLLATVAQYGRAAFRAVSEYVFSGSASPEVVSEALRWVADIKDPSTLRERWFLLQQTLRDRSPRIRDGAILGFAALDDPRARSILEEAQRAEPLVELRRTLDDVIQQLNATANASTPPHNPPEPMA